MVAHSNMTLKVMFSGQLLNCQRVFRYLSFEYIWHQLWHTQLATVTERNSADAQMPLEESGMWDLVNAVPNFVTGPTIHFQDTAKCLDTCLPLSVCISDDHNES